MPTYKTPDVYIEEISVFPPSVAEVETAVPAFIGHTEKAVSKTGADLTTVPTKIYSLKDYELYFGFPNDDQINVTYTPSTGGVVVDEPDPTYIMYYSVKMFFDNGGGKCYIVSVGNYAVAQTAALFNGGLDVLALEDEPTLIVIPEAVKLSDVNNYKSVITHALLQCGTLGDRFAIVDVYHGTDPDIDLDTDRDLIVSPWLKYGAAYYPFIKTALNYYVTPLEDNVVVTITGVVLPPTVTLADLGEDDTRAYNLIKAELTSHFITLPPSGAVAGVYAATDNARGVWKAPANVPLADVVEPVVKLDNAHQDDMNVDATAGKSINAIRAFAGKGTLVWGARTLDGNSNEWPTFRCAGSSTWLRSR